MTAAVQIRELERIATFTALGLRFWDGDFARVVNDGMIATARVWGRPNDKPVIAVRTFSGALTFQGLPGLRTVENQGPDAPLPPPPTRRFLVELADQKRRYASMAFGVELPLPYRGPYVGPTLPSPPPPGFMVVTGPERPRDPARARVTGEVALAATGAPAAWAMVSVTDPQANVWNGLADAGGRFSVVLPWPTLDEIDPEAPAPGAANPLLQRSWPVTIAIRASQTPLSPITSSGIPDYASVLAQPATNIWSAPPTDPSPPSPTPSLAADLRIGEPLVLRSGPSSSRLFVGAAPPSSP